MEREVSCGNECTKKLSCSHICGEICHAGSCRSPLLCTKSTRVFCKCKRIKKVLFFFSFLLLFLVLLINYLLMYLLLFL